jgi:hypothetical protein
VRSGNPGRKPARALVSLLLVRRFASVLVVFPMLVNQPAKDVLVPFGVGLETA